MDVLFEGEDKEFEVGSRLKHIGYFWRGGGRKAVGKQDGKEERDSDSHLQHLREAGENYVCCRCQGGTLLGDRRSPTHHTGV